MDPEVRQELTTIHALVKDNHDMLRAMRRHMWYGVIFRIIFWTGLIIIPIYLAQQYIQPIMDKFTVPAASPATKGSFGLPSTADIEKLINLYTGGNLSQ